MTNPNIGIFLDKADTDPALAEKVAGGNRGSGRPHEEAKRKSEALGGFLSGTVDTIKEYAPSATTIGLLNRIFG